MTAINEITCTKQKKKLNFRKCIHDFNPDIQHLINIIKQIRQVLPVDFNKICLDAFLLTKYNLHIFIKPFSISKMLFCLIEKITKTNSSRKCNNCYLAERKHTPWVFFSNICFPEIKCSFLNTTYLWMTLRFLTTLKKSIKSWS